MIVKIKEFENLSLNELDKRALRIVNLLDNGNLKARNTKILENTYDKIIKRYNVIACNNDIMLMNTGYCNFNTPKNSYLREDYHSEYIKGSSL